MVYKVIFNQLIVLVLHGFKNLCNGCSCIDRGLYSASSAFPEQSVFRVCDRVYKNFCITDVKKCLGRKIFRDIVFGFKTGKRFNAVIVNKSIEF